MIMADPAFFVFIQIQLAQMDTMAFMASSRAVSGHRSLSVGNGPGIQQLCFHAIDAVAAAALLLHLPLRFPPWDTFCTTVTAVAAIQNAYQSSLPGENLTMPMGSFGMSSRQSGEPANKDLLMWM